MAPNTQSRELLRPEAPPVPVLSGNAKSANSESPHDKRGRIALNIAMTAIGILVSAYILFTVVEFMYAGYLAWAVWSVYGGMLLAMLLAVIALCMAAPLRTTRHQIAALIALIAGAIPWFSPWIFNYIRKFLP